MQAFENALNEERKSIYEKLSKGSQLKRLIRGKWKYVFLKKASRRSEEERRHIDDVTSLNKDFSKLEIIKESMFNFFQSENESEAWELFDEVGRWIVESGLNQLKKWHDNLEQNWDTLKNYFKYRITSALSEGQNNVIKTLKRRAYGYRNMAYFKLKILQVCGFLNSRYVPMNF